MRGRGKTFSICVKSPTNTLNGKNPYEVWSGKKPDLGHIKVFGCITYMKVPSVHVKKLDDRSRQVAYLGR